MKDKVVAIDGPSGSGKSTIARRIAHDLNFLYIDTGAMFRALGYEANKRNIEIKESSDLEKFLSELKIKYMVNDEILIQIDGVDLSQVIREHYVSALASRISRIKMVRDFLLDFQRSLAVDKICIMEGRDIGTVVFPNAFCKIYLTATLEVRAKRRLDQLQEQGATNLNFTQTLKDIRERDYHDANRQIAPLKEAEDAHFIDSSGILMEGVIKIIEERIKLAANMNGIDL